MHKIVGIFVDVNNLYYCANKAFNRKVNYEKLYALAQGDDFVNKAIAYGYQQDREANSFISSLKHCGFTTQYKKPRNGRRISWGCGIAVDVFRLLDKLDRVVLASSDTELLPLIEYIKSRGIEVHVIACGIPREIKSIVDKFTEVTEEILQDANSTESVELPADSTGDSAEPTSGENN